MKLDGLPLAALVHRSTQALPLFKAFTGTFNPAIYSIRDKPFTAKRVYTFRRIRPEELNSAGHCSRSAALTAAPDLSEEVIVARDKAGRVRYETRRPAKGEITVMIYDPIAHTLSQYYVSPIAASRTTLSLRSSAWNS